MAYFHCLLPIYKLDAFRYICGMQAVQRQWTPLILLILAGESIFFLPFVLVRIFRPTVLRFFEVTNLELGTCFSIYGIVAMVSYFFGGPLADRVAPGKLIATGLWATALGGIVLALHPTLSLMYFVYGYWGFTTIFLFWAPLIKATRLWGGSAFQGRAFGGLESGRGLAAALLGSLSVLVFSTTTTNSIESYHMIVWGTSIWVALLGGIIWFLLRTPATKTEQKHKTHPVQWITHSEIWKMALIILCAYVGYKITDDYSLYAHEVLGMNETQSAGVGSSALWLRPVFALLAGWLADRFQSKNMVTFGFGSMVLGGLLVASGWLSGSIGTTLLLLATTLVGVYGIRGIYFALMKDAAIPAVATGTAVGVLSVVGYTPDVFMSPLMGFLLDNYPGAIGHQLVFTVLSGFALLGLLVALRLKRSV